MPAEHTPDMPPFTPMTRERFEHVLAGIRNAASATLIGFAVGEITEGERHDAVIADARAVWHAAEVALGVLRPGYVPKREALDDMRALLRWLDDDDRSWLSTD